MNKEKETFFLALVGAGLLLCGEYYLLFFASLDSLPNNLWVAKILKIYGSYGTWMRLGFVACYGLYLLMSEDSIAPRKRKNSSTKQVSTKKVLVCSGLALVSVLALWKIGAVGNWGMVLYPLALAGVLYGLNVVGEAVQKMGGQVSVPNDRRSIVKEGAISLQATDGSYINIPNPFRGVGIAGEPGSGKTESMIVPIMQQLIRQKFSGIIYSFKGDSLAREAYSALLAAWTGVKLYKVDFSSKRLDSSHRVNPIASQYMPTISHAREYATAMYNNLRPRSIQKMEFWDENAVLLIEATMWYLKKHHKAYCNIPTVVAMCCIEENYNALMNLLESDTETAVLASSIISAHKDPNASPQSKGVSSTIQSSLAQLNTREIFWILSGDDVPLDLNNPDKPSILVVCSDETISDTLSPVIATIFTVALKLMNQPGKHQSFCIVDELPTLYIPMLPRIPATGRSNRIAVILAWQAFAQLVVMYGRDKAKEVVNTLANRINGRSSDVEVGKEVSELLGNLKIKHTSHNVNSGSKGSSSEGYTHTYQNERRVEISDVVNLQSGEFVGLVAEADNPAFWARVKQRKQTIPAEIPGFATGIDVDTNYEYVHTVAQGILSGAIARDKQPGQAVPNPAQGSNQAPSPNP